MAKKKSPRIEAHLFTNDKEFLSLFQDTLKQAELISAESPLWVTSDGRTFRISDMSTEHIRNCIKMIYQHNGNWKHEYLRHFEKELRRRRWMGRDFDDDTLTINKKKLGRLLKELGTIIENS